MSKYTMRSSINKAYSNKLVSNYLKRQQEGKLIVSNKVKQQAQ